jgi:thiol-disulfide isomerase/thioredoxin
MRRTVFGMARVLLKRRTHVVQSGCSNGRFAPLDRHQPSSSILPLTENGFIMLTNTQRYFVAVIASFAVIGCSQNSNQSTEEITTTFSDDISVAEPPVASKSIRLIAGNWDDVQATVNQSAGKVVVVDLWSTSCPPCIEQLPHLGELQRAEPNNVVCISLSVDYSGAKTKPPGFYRGRVEQVLTYCEATVLNYLCTTESGLIFQSLDLSSIPAVYVYDVDGTLVQRFDASLLDEDSEDEEPFTYEHDILPLVETLISAHR